MTQEALRMALEALKTLHDENMDYLTRNKLGGENNQCMVFARQAIAAIEEALAQEQVPVHHAVIAGALFDFMGWLTSRKERIVLSSADDASPAVDAIRDFAKMRNLSLDYAKVQDWNPTPPQQESVAHLWECLGRWAAYLVNNGKQAERVPPSWLVDAIRKATIPPQQEQKLVGTVGDLFDDRVIAHRKLDRDLLVYTAAP